MSRIFELAGLMLRNGGIARAFANRNYRIYTSGNAVSLIGTWVQRVATGWLTWELTQSGTWLGLVAAAEFFPSVFANPLGGAIADRFDRLQLTRICQSLLALQAAVLGVLTLMGLMTPELLFALTFFLGVVTAFNQPARLSLVPSLVRREDISAAVAVNSVLWNGARFVGPAVAGVLIVGIGVGWAFLVNALSYAAFLLAIHFIHLPPLPAKAKTMGMGREIVEGFAYVLQHKGIGPLILLLVLSSVTARPFAEMLPGFADDVFGRGADALAMLTAATGFGAVVGGVWLGQAGRSTGLTRLTVWNVLLLALAILAFAATDWLPFALVSVAVAGFAMVASGVATQSQIQSSTDPAMLGRVLSIYGLTFRAGPAIGALAIGGLSEAFGLRLPVAGGAAICILGWMWAYSRRHQIEAYLEAPAASPAATVAAEIPPSRAAPPAAQQ